MTWWAVGTMVVGGVISHQDAKKSNKAAKDAGKVDVTSTEDPWAPSDPYRQFLMDEARRLYGGGSTLAPTPAAPRGAPPPVPPGGSVRPDGRILDAKGKTIYTPPGGAAKKGKGGTTKAPTAPAPPKFEGVSPQTDVVRDALIQRAQKGNPLYDVAERATTDILSGDPARDPNAYRGEAADLLRGVTDDPDLRRFKDMLFGSDTGLGPAAAPTREGLGGEVRRGNSNPAGAAAARLAQQGGGGAGYLPGAPATGDNLPGSGPVGVVDDFRDILSGKYLSEENPHLEAVLARTKSQADDAFAEATRQNALRAAGGGMYGATPWQNIQAQAQEGYGTGLGQALGGIRYEEYERRMADLMNALQGGAAYDTAALDRAAQERIAEGNQSAAGAGAGAALKAAQAEIASRERLARLGMLGEAVGMGTDLGKFRAGGFGELAGMMSADQQAALGLVPDLSGLDVRDWATAGDLSLGSDQTRTGYLADRGRERVGMAGVGVDRGRLNFDMARYNDPTSALGRFADIVNAASSGYGTSRDFGYDKRAQNPGRAASPGAAAISGGLAGYSLGQDIAAGRTSAAPSQAPTSYAYNPPRWR